MKAPVGVLTGMLLLCLRAQAQCPADFIDAGQLSASAGAGRYQEVTATKDLLLPMGIRIDGSYRQRVVHAAGDGAASNLRAVAIPPGIHLIPGGRTAGGSWSVDNPKLEPAAVDASGKVVQWKFRMDLYANTGSRAAPATAQNNGPAIADVRVQVCVKAEK